MSESSRWMRVLANSPADDAARAGWRESCRLQPARSGRAKRPALKPGDQALPTSSGVAAGGGAEAAAAMDRAPPGSRHRARDRHDLSVATAHPEPDGRTPHPDPPPQRGREMCRPATSHPDPPPRGGREMCHEARPHPDPPPQGGRARCRRGGGGAAEVEDAARDRTVRRLVAARRIAGRRQAEIPGRPNSPE